MRGIYTQDLGNGYTLIDRGVDMDLNHVDGTSIYITGKQRYDFYKGRDAFDGTLGEYAAAYAEKRKAA